MQSALTYWIKCQLTIPINRLRMAARGLSFRCGVAVSCVFALCLNGGNRLKTVMKFTAQMREGILRNATILPMVVLLALVPGAFAAPILVANPSFETLPTGWPNVLCGGSCAYDVGLPIPNWNSTGSETGQYVRAVSAAIRPQSMAAYWRTRTEARSLRTWGAPSPA